MSEHRVPRGHLFRRMADGSALLVGEAGLIAEGDTVRLTGYEGGEITLRVDRIDDDSALHVTQLLGADE